ncbi:MAG: DNA polymerase III subunit gamma/tau [bacterium]|nr:DNA polymerase III subunit gamma/tau [bacterium]
MFYRKYRPQNFEGLVGIGNIKSSILSQIVNNTFAHAYLFIGPRGTGKTTLARLFAKAINCEKPGKNGEPCNKCESCKSINNGSFIDLIELDAASNRGIDDVRLLREGVKLAPYNSKYKVYIIDEVHMLTTEAFNALLKTLEEPPAHSIFILATTDAHKIPETVKSRCQVLEFSRAKMDDIVTVLDSIAKQEQFKIEKDDLVKIAKASKGGFRDAVTLLEQVVTSDLQVDEVVGSTDTQNYEEMISSLIEGKPDKAVILINDLYEKGVDLPVYTEGLVFYIRDILLVSVGQESLVSDEEKTLEKLKFFASKLNQTHIIKLIDVFTKAQLDFRYAVTPQLPLEIAVLTLLKGKEDVVEVVEESKKKDLKISKQASHPELVSGSESSIVLSKEKDSQKAIPPVKGIDQSEKISSLISNWVTIAEKVAGINSSLSSIIKNAKPVNIDKNNLILEVYYSFHKERIEAVRNRQVIENVLAEFIGECIITCIIGEKTAIKVTTKDLGLKNKGDLIDANVKNVEIDIDDLAKLLED